jgi:hypothetical protein
MKTLAALVALSIPYASAQPQAGRLATLEIRVTDSFGDAVQDWRITKLTDRTGKDWKSSLGTGGIARIPAGYYSLRVEHNKFLLFDRTVHVRPPTTLYIAGLVLAGFEDNPPGDLVRGRFESPPGENSWCKLSGLETIDNYFATVAADGKFQFPYVWSGDYVLVCRRESKTLEVRTIMVSPPTSEIIIAPGK